MAALISMQTMPHNSRWTLVAKDLGAILIESPSMGASNTGGGGWNQRFSTSISLSQKWWKIGT